MIRTENIIINEKEFIRTYSDSGFMIERDGVQYDEAIDPIDTNRTYTETDTKRESFETDSEYRQAWEVCECRIYNYE